MHHSVLQSWKLHNEQYKVDMSSRAFNIADHMKNLQGTRTLASGAKIVGADADSIQAPGLITTAGGGLNSSLSTTLSTTTGVSHIKMSGTNHTFDFKVVNQPISGATYSTNDDANSDQLAIYNGSTKLWGISEAGYVVNPTLPCFVAHVTGGAYTSTSGVFPANETNHNQGNHYSTSTYAFTAPIDGVYLFTFSALSNNTGSSSRPMFYVNGSSTYNGIQHGIGNVDGNGSNSNATSCLIKLTAGDYVQVKSQNGSLYYYAGAHSSFSGCLIG